MAVRMIRPTHCFGFSLQTGTRLVAILQMVLAISLLAVSIKRIATDERFDSWVSISAFFIIQILFALFSFMLFEASKHRNLQSCTIWIYATCLLTVVTGIYVVFELYDNSFLKFYSSDYILLSIISIVSNVGFIWVTDGFAYELRDEESEGNYHT